MVNDRSATQRVMQSLSGRRCSVASMRRVDSVARVGGDEFMLLLPEDQSGGGRSGAGRTHRCLVEAAAAEGWEVGYSVGAVTFTSPPDSIEGMIARADQTMYEVKQLVKGTIRYSIA